MGSCPKAIAEEDGFVVAVQPIAAVVAFRDFGFRIGTAQVSRTGEHEFLALFDEGTDERDDERVRRRGIQLGVRGVVQAANVARVLDERVLNSRARAEKGTESFAGQSNRGEHSLGVGEAAGGDAPDSIERREIGRRDWNGAGVDPDGFDGCVPGGGSEAQGLRNGLVGDDRWVVISDEGDAERGIINR